MAAPPASYTLSLHDALPIFFEGLTMETVPVKDVVNARVLALLGDSITTDHISPAGSIKKDSPAGKYLMAHGVEPRRSEEHTSELQSHHDLVCRLLLEKKK